MISIIIPVYKSEKTIIRCIRSIQQQTFRDIEMIIVVDGVGDGSLPLVQELAVKDARIKVIEQSNKGVSSARNAGIDAASGQYIQFLDSDDYLEEDACQKLISAIEKWNCDMVIAGFNHLYFGKKVLKLPSVTGRFAISNAEAEFLALYEEQFLNMPWNKLYKAELMQNRFISLRNLGEDLLFNIDYMHAIQSFGVIQEPICNYIQDGRGTTLSTKKRNDRIETSMALYGAVHRFCEEMWGNQEGRDVNYLKTLKSKVAVEFLDDMESLAFERIGMMKKIQVIREYGTFWEKIDKNSNVNLKLLDYRILFFFFKLRRYRAMYFLIEVRGMMVKVMRGMRGKR